MSDETDMEYALDRHTDHFQELRTVSREPILELNSIAPLSNLREQWQNVTSNASEHQLSTAADTNDLAFLETEEHGEYSSGFMTQCGMGVRIPANPTGDSEIRWGYYEVDANGDPFNGFYFGVDSEGIFVARASGGDIQKVYQDSWNTDQFRDGNNVRNPSGETLDLADGSIFEIEFSYYGYGPIEMQIAVGDTAPSIQRQHVEMQTAHVFDVDGQTSTDNTNLPLRQEIVSGGTSNDALDAFVGGRQISIIGMTNTESRNTGHYLDSLANVDDTKWYAAISFRVKDGTDIGSIDFGFLQSTVSRFEVDTDDTGYRWQIRRGTQLSAPTWENPTSAEDNQDETGLKADTSSADVQDGSGNLTGIYVDGGTLGSGSNNDVDIIDVGASGQLTPDESITLLFKAVPGGIGTLSEIYFQMKERW